MIKSTGYKLFVKAQNESTGREKFCMLSKVPVSIPWWYSRCCVIHSISRFASVKVILL